MSEAGFSAEHGGSKADIGGTGDGAGGGGARLRLSVVVINYGTAELTIQCLASLAEEAPGIAGAGVVVVDNDSPDDSAAQIERAIVERGWGGWARLVRSPVNGGFSAGNNVGIKAQEAELYLLLNSDTVVRPGALAELLRAAKARPEAGIIGPRLTWPDGEAQASAFRARRPVSELVRAAGTGPLTRVVRALAGEVESALPITDEPVEAEWVSFACALIRREVVERVGLLDEGYFMYFEDMDYCVTARGAGFGVVHWPAAIVVHLRGGTSPVKEAAATRRRPPDYFYRSRTRYFVKRFGRPGLWLANVMWWVGRGVAMAREIVGNKRPHACAREWRDIWIGAGKPG